MLGFVSQGAPGPEEVIKIATAMAMPAAAKARLQDIGQQNKRREEIAALKAQADAAMLASDKRAAEIEQRAAVLDAANAKRAAELSKRVAAFEKVIGEFEGKLAEHKASLDEITP